MNEFDDTRFITPEQKEEALTLPYGFKVHDDGSLETQLVFDGDTIMFRNDDGEIASMDVLCYLDLVMKASVQALCDKEGNVIHQSGVHPGLVLCAMVDHLHGQYHRVALQKRMQELFSGEGGGLAQALAEMMGGGSEPGLAPIAAFAVGSDGSIEQIGGSPEDGLGAMVADAVQSAREGAANEDKEKDDGISIEGGGFPGFVVPGIPGDDGKH